MGVARDDAEAVSWYRKAAEQGSARAQLNLGVMYGQGRGVAASDAAAFQWIRMAATQNLAIAQNNLGFLYERGRGVARDFGEAVLRAVNLGDDADTTGAICGQLAGAYWGASGIPKAWCDGLARRDLIEQALAGLGVG